jgi:hypothetical protein
MVTVDWLSRILERSLGTRTLREARAVPRPLAISVSRERPLPARAASVLECPHCHSLITDFELETG